MEGRPLLGGRNRRSGDSRQSLLAASAAAEGGAADFLSADAAATHEKETRLRLRRQRDLDKIRDAEERLQAAVVWLLQKRRNDPALLPLSEVSAHLLSQHPELTASALLVLKRSLPEVLAKSSRLFVGRRKVCLERQAQVERRRALQQGAAKRETFIDVGDDWNSVSVRRNDSPLGLTEAQTLESPWQTSEEARTKGDDEEEEEEEELFVLLQRLSPAEVNSGETDCC